jgi:hypothetical protein
MSVERFSPIMPSSTSMLAHVSDWGTRLIAPLGASLMSKDGMLEVAGRVYWIFPLMIAAVIVAKKYGYLTGRATPSDSSSTNPTGVNADFNDLLRDVKKLRQLMLQEKNLMQQYHQQTKLTPQQMDQLLQQIAEQQQPAKNLMQCCYEVKGLTEQQVDQLSQQTADQKRQIWRQMYPVWQRIEQSKTLRVNTGFVGDLNADFKRDVQELVQLRQQDKQNTKEYGQSFGKGVTQQQRDQQHKQIHQRSQQLDQQVKQVWQRIDPMLV